MTNYLFENPADEPWAVTTSTWGALGSCPGSRGRDTVKSSEPPGRGDSEWCPHSARWPPAQVRKFCREVPEPGTARCSCAATVAVPGHFCLQQLLGQPPPSRCSALWPELPSGVLEFGAAWASVPSVGPPPWQGVAGRGSAPGDRVHPSLRPGSLPALSPPVVWGIGDCAVVIKGLKQFSVSFDFTEQMLSPLFPTQCPPLAGLCSASCRGEQGWAVPDLLVQHRACPCFTPGTGKTT